MKWELVPVELMIGTATVATIICAMVYSIDWTVF